MARSRFAFATSLSVILVGLLGPLLGAIADYRGSKKLFLGAFLGLGAAATAAMYFIAEGQWGFALATFVVGNVAVTSTLAFYNSLLPSIASADEVDRVSTAGFALGYLGGGLLLALNMAMIGNPQRFGIPDAGAASRLVVPERRRVVGALLHPALPPGPRARAAGSKRRRRAARARSGSRRAAWPGPSASCASTRTRESSSSPSSSTTTPSTRSSGWPRPTGTRSASPPPT